MRDEIVKTINEIIKEDFPCNWEYKEIKENNLLTDSNMDSFGYAMFWLQIAEKYPILKDIESLKDKEKSEAINKYVNNIDYKTYKVKDLVDRIVECI